MNECVPTNWVRMDKMLSGGLRPGEFYVFGGPTRIPEPPSPGGVMDLLAHPVPTTPLGIRLRKMRVKQHIATGGTVVWCNADFNVSPEVFQAWLES